MQFLKIESGIIQIKIHYLLHLLTLLSLKIHHSISNFFVLYYFYYTKFILSYSYFLAKKCFKNCQSLHMLLHLERYSLTEHSIARSSIVKLTWFIRRCLFVRALPIETPVCFELLRLHFPLCSLRSMLNELVLHLIGLLSGSRRMELLGYRCLVSIRNCKLHCLLLLLEISLDFLIFLNLLCRFPEAFLYSDLGKVWSQIAFDFV